MNTPIDLSAVVLTTPRLILRPWRESDLSDLYAYAHIDGVGQMAGWIPHENIAQSQTILSSFIAHRKTFALEFQDKVIGSLGVENYAEETFPELAPLRGRELGYVLSRDFWGLGLMPEAVNAVAEYLFTAQNLDFLIVGHFDWNRQSARVAQKCGFRYVRTARFETRYDTVETSLQYIRYHPNFSGKEPL